MTEYGFVIVSGLAAGASYALAGAVFGLVFFVTGRFHFAFGLYYSLSGMLAAWLVAVHGWSNGPAIVAALLAGTAGGVLTELIVYRTLDRRVSGLSFLGVFIASLGLVVAGEAAMGLIFNQAATFNIQLVNPGVWHVDKVAVPYIKALVFIVCWISLIVLFILVNRSSVGRQMRAVESSPDLSGDFGINTKRIFLIVFAVVSFFGGILGILQAGSVTATTTMGDSVIIYAIVVAFLGRGRSVLTIGLIGEALGIVEALVGYQFGQLLQSLVVFVVLLMFVIGLGYAPAVQLYRLRRRSAALDAAAPPAKALVNN
jgi:branched-chain amino acid transport system permease protein